MSLETRPEVRSMRYKFRLEFIIYLQSVWLFSESIAVSEVVFSEYCSQFGGFHRELRLVRWFSQNIAVNSVLFADYCSQFGDLFRVLRVPATNKINH